MTSQDPFNINKNVFRVPPNYFEDLEESQVEAMSKAFEGSSDRFVKKNPAGKNTTRLTIAILSMAACLAGFLWWGKPVLSNPDLMQIEQHQVVTYLHENLDEITVDELITEMAATDLPILEKSAVKIEDLSPEDYEDFEIEEFF